MSKPTLMRLAFEDVETQSAAIVNSPSEGDEGLLSVDESDLQEARDDSDKIDELISTTGAMEAIEEAVQTASQQDGLGPQAAKALDVAFEHINRRLGVAESQRLSLESFSGGASTRRVATLEALENIGEKIRRIIERIVDWIKRMAVACFEAIERLMRGADAVIARAQKVYRAASAQSHGNFHQANLKKINTAGLLSFFNDNGKSLAAQEIVHRYIAFCDDVNKTFNAGKLFQPSITGLRELERYVSAHGEKAVDVGTIEGFAASAVDQLVRESLHGYAKKDRNGVQVLTKKLPFGNAALVFSFAQGVTDDTKLVGFNATIETDEAANTPAELEPLKPQEVMNLMTVLTAQMSKGIYHDSKQIRRAIQDVASRVENESYKLSDRQRYHGASIVPTLNLIKTISDSSLKLTRLLYGYSGVTTRRLLAYGEESLAVYRGASNSRDSTTAQK